MSRAVVGSAVAIHVVCTFFDSLRHGLGACGLVSFERVLVGVPVHYKVIETAHFILGAKAQRGPLVHLVK